MWMRKKNGTHFPLQKFYYETCIDHYNLCTGLGAAILCMGSHVGIKKAQTQRTGQITPSRIKKTFALQTYEFFLIIQHACCDYFVFPLSKDTKKQGEKQRKSPVYRCYKEVY